MKKSFIVGCLVVLMFIVGGCGENTNNLPTSIEELSMDMYEPNESVEAYVKENTVQLEDLWEVRELNAPSLPEVTYELVNNGVREQEVYDTIFNFDFEDLVKEVKSNKYFSEMYDLRVFEEDYIYPNVYDGSSPDGDYVSSYKEIQGAYKDSSDYERFYIRVGRESNVSDKYLSISFNCISTKEAQKALEDILGKFIDKSYVEYLLYCKDEVKDDFPTVLDMSEYVNAGITSYQFYRDYRNTSTPEMQGFIKLGTYDLKDYSNDVIDIGTLYDTMSYKFEDFMTVEAMGSDGSDGVRNLYDKFLGKISKNYRYSYFYGSIHITRTTESDGTITNVLESDVRANTGIANFINPGMGINYTTVEKEGELLECTCVLLGELYDRSAEEADNDDSVLFEKARTLMGMLLSDMDLTELFNKDNFVNNECERFAERKVKDTVFDAKVWIRLGNWDNFGIKYEYEK